MADLIYLTGADGVLTPVVSTGYATEDDLQKLLADNLHLLEGAGIGPEGAGRWLLVKREAGVPNREGGGDWWSLDHLVVDQDGVPTFIEVKRATDTRARREVVAQMLDYAANGTVFWTPDRLRGMYEAEHGDASDQRLLDWLAPGDDADPDSAVEDFWLRVGTNLRNGRVRLIFVADEIPDSLRRLVEFLNEQMPRVEVLAVEIRQYLADGTDLRAVVPRLVGQTSRAEAVKERSAPATAARARAVPWTADEFLQSISESDDAASSAARVVLDWARERRLTMTGGTGAVDASLNFDADLGDGSQRLLSLYGTPHGGRPLFEVQVRRMLTTPPYDEGESQSRLKADLAAVGVPRMSTEEFLSKIRPNLYLDELGDGRVDRLLAVLDRWMDDVRNHSAGSRSA
ncbi:MAG: PDDEXK family nuclease [Streptosporangiaceae bacterium]